MIEAAKELYPNANSIEWNFKELKIDGVIVDHKPLIKRAEALKELSIKEKDKDIERKWVDGELIKVRELIEDAEDLGQKAPRLRGYRQALKQYKSDLYMPNVSRPSL